MAKGQRDSNREAFWRGVLAKFRDSGLTIRNFCQQAKVTEASFYAWRRTIQERDAEAKRRTSPRQQHPTFVPLLVRDDQTDGANTGITIEFGNGPRARVLRLPATIAADRLVDLIRAVESIPVPAERCS
jgi:hypothetical protein